jgi:hypothetical protein
MEPISVYTVPSVKNKRSDTVKITIAPDTPMSPPVTSPPVVPPPVSLSPTPGDITPVSRHDLLKEWKKKCGIQALICYNSSIYYSFMDIFFGVPPIIMTSIIGVMEGYGGTEKNEVFFMTKIILAPLSALFGAIHLQCEYASLSAKFKSAYNQYSCIKRDIDLFETMNHDEDFEKIIEFKKRIDAIRESSPTPPWIVFRKFDDLDELTKAETFNDRFD